MPTNNKHHKPLFKLVVMPESIFMQAPRPKRNTVILITLMVLLGIALLIASNEPGLHSKALELVISIIEAILTFFSATLKNK
jgi:hypothetical protein